MDPGNVIAAGPSNIPPPVAEKRTEGHKKRKHNKRKRITSEASTSVTGEHAEADARTEGDSASVDVNTEVWSAPWLESLGTTSYDSKEQRLHDEIVAFFHYISPTPDESHARAMVIMQISEVARRRFAQSSVDTFGSVAQNLYLPDGDTDLVINTPNPYNGEMKKRALFQLAALMRNTRLTPHVQVIPRARVPVISFQTVPDLGSLKIDISLNAADGVKAVPILRGWFDRMPALRFLVMCIKSLLSRYQLNTASSSGLSSYAIICLAVSFLQLNPMQRPAECIERPMKSESLGILLMDFLNYYGNVFDYVHSVVSVAEGKVLSKEAKGWENPTNPESLCIECMLNPENDVGRPTSKIRKIRKVFQDAYAALDAYPFLESPTAHNVLGSILGVSASTLAHRVLLREIVVSGRLTQALRNVEQSAAALYSTGGGAPRRPQPSQRSTYARTNARPHSDNPSGAHAHARVHGLPPKPPPQKLEAAVQHGLPPRPAQKAKYVPQGPSFGAMRAGAAGSGTVGKDVNGGSAVSANGKDRAIANPTANSDAPEEMRSPPRRRRKAA